MRHRTQIGITASAVPYYWGVAVALRLLELAGMVAAVVTPDRFAGASASPAPTRG